MKPFRRLVKHQLPTTRRITKGGLWSAYVAVQGGRTDEEDFLILGWVRWTGEAWEAARNGEGRWRGAFPTPSDAARSLV